MPVATVVQAYHCRAVAIGFYADIVFLQPHSLLYAAACDESFEAEAAVFIGNYSLGFTASGPCAVFGVGVENGQGMSMDLRGPVHYRSPGLLRSCDSGKSWPEGTSQRVKLPPAPRLRCPPGRARR
jgi:hypothetical protein